MYFIGFVFNHISQSIGFDLINIITRVIIITEIRNPCFFFKKLQCTIKFKRYVYIVLKYLNILLHCIAGTRDVHLWTQPSGHR